MQPATGKSYPLGELNKLLSIYRKMQLESTIQSPSYSLHLNVCIKMESTIEAVLQSGAILLACIDARF